jgi:hypothetical protein
MWDSLNGTLNNSETEFNSTAENDLSTLVKFLVFAFVELNNDLCLSQTRRWRSQSRLDLEEGEVLLEGEEE